MLGSQSGDRPRGKHLRHEPSQSVWSGGSRRQQRPRLVLVERRPAPVGLVATELGMGVEMGVGPAEAAVAQRLVHVGETGHHPLVAAFVPKDRCRFAQSAEHGIGVGDELRVVDVEPLDEHVQIGHASTVPRHERYIRCLLGLKG